MTFAQRFEKGLVSDFRHADHVRLAWEYLDRYPLRTAVSRFRRELKRFARRKGQPRLYHETITVAFLRIIDSRKNGTKTWRAFAAANGDLLRDGRGVLLRLYRKRTLESSEARRRYLAPDRARRGAAL